MTKRWAQIFVRAGLLNESQQAGSHLAPKKSGILLGLGKGSSRKKVPLFKSQQIGPKGGLILHTGPAQVPMVHCLGLPISLVLPLG